MSTVGQPTTYTAYLLRCWLDGSKWRYSLEQVGSGKRQGFATLDEFVTFLVAMSTLPSEGKQVAGVEGNPTKAKNEASAGARSSSNDER